jgi:hypothetical protein
MDLHIIILLKYLLIIYNAQKANRLLLNTLNILFPSHLGLLIRNYQHTAFSDKFFYQVI